MGGSSGGGSQTTTTTPWGPATHGMKAAMTAGRRAFSRGDFNTYTRPGAVTRNAQDSILATARGGTPFMDQVGAPTMLDVQSSGEIYRDLDRVKQNALGGALPAAASAFGMSGMADSSAAADFAGRAAMEAVAPIEYGAYNQSMDRMLQAGMANQGAELSFAGMAPQLEAARYMPDQMRLNIGAMRDADRMARNNGRLNNILGYGQFAQSFGGQGGSVTGPGQPGVSPLGAIAGGALTGLGTYGSLIGAGMATGGAAIPLAIGAGGLSALGGLL
jgi:hypothetical protein